MQALLDKPNPMTIQTVPHRTNSEVGSLQFSGWLHKDTGLEFHPMQSSTPIILRKLYTINPCRISVVGPFKPTLPNPYKKATVVFKALAG